jgi:hypothetical protein
MARTWIELGGEQAGWGPTRIVVAKLSRDGYVAQVLIGTRFQEAFRESGRYGPEARFAGPV